VAIKCSKCHSDNTDFALYCSNCATSLTAAGKQDVSVTRMLETTAGGLFRGALFAGRYEIIEELGRGGMGVVYKAKDTKLGRTVALKFLPPEWTSDPQAKERFVREARAAAALDHPHICAVYEIDEAEGRMFISMAFVEGETLRTKIEHGSLRLEEAVDIGIQVAAGLKEAHLKGIVHRDIKSANIMVSDEGQAKILDFGLAKVRGGVLVTKEGATMGTVAYMSPEQARGEDVDHRTDIWSLGVVLYQALTGHPPFHGEHDQVVLHSILHQDPRPLRKLRAGIPAALERIVDRALEKKQEERYQSADGLLADLAWVKKELAAGSFEEGLSWPKILLKRRVPQVFVLYVLASLGLLQLVKWLVDRFILSPHLPDFSLAALLSFVPMVLFLAYFHGRPGPRKWARAEKIGIAANLAASAALLVFMFNGKSLGAATTTVTLKNEEGQIVERVIPKSEFRKNFAIFFFDNKTDDPSQNWLQYAIPQLLQFDLAQDLFVQAYLGYDFIDKMKAAGFQEGVRLPLALQNKIARDRHLKYFVSGSILKEGEEFVLETTIHETKRATEVARSEFRGRDIFQLTDRMSLKIRRDLGIPEKHIKDVKDLPVSEIATASVQALKSYVEGFNALHFEMDWDRSLKSFEQSAAEDPTFVYVQKELQGFAFVMNQPEKAERAARSLMQHLYKLPERHQYLFKSSYYLYKEDKDKQIAVLKMMVELSPEDIEGHRSLADLYSEINRRDDALLEFKRILEIDPEQKDVLLDIGSLYREKGEHETALEYYEKYAAQFPEDVKSIKIIGDLYQRMGDFERARTCLQKANLIEPENISILRTIADIESALGNFEVSEKICRDALRNAKTPQERTGLYDSLSSLFETQGRFRRSLEYALLSSDEVRKLVPSFAAFAVNVGSYRKFIMAGQKDEAFKLVEEIKSQAAPPFDRLVPLIYLQFYIELGDVEKAAEALKDVESTPTNSLLSESIRPSIPLYQGRVHEMRAEYEQAIAAYKRYSEIRPADFGINLAIGRSYRKLKELKKAEEYLQKGLRTGPFDPEIHYELALVHIEKGGKKRALEHLNTALDIWKNADPGIPKVEDAKRKLAELKVPESP
jgi:serine/threonine protein kinase/tetratricopeptide (TPR) repeat protein